MRDVVTHSTAFEDKNGALIFATSKKMMPRSKHIGIKYHHFRKAVDDGIVKIKRVNSEKQRADIFTKGLSMLSFQEIYDLLMGW